MKSITAVRHIQDILNDQGIVFCYSGYMTEDILLSIGATVRQKLELVETDKSEARAIFAVFVEEAQNIIRYSSDMLFEEGAPPIELRRGFIAIGKEEGRYFVCCGNLIPQLDVNKLHGHLNEIREMNEAELKKMYKKVLRGEVPEGSKGAGVGFIDIARRAKNGFDFDFKKVNSDHSYFFLKAFI